MARFTIIGAAGYLGGALASHLVGQGHTVVAVFRTYPSDPGDLMSKLSSVVQADATNPGFVSRVIETNPEHIIYCVSLDHQESERDLSSSVDVNVKPLLQLARGVASDLPSTSITYLSTLQVYGKIGVGEEIVESREARPENLYGLTHLMCETGLQTLSRGAGLRANVVRLANGYGPPVFPSASFSWLAINDFCKSAVANSEIVLKSDGSAQRDFVFVEDIAHAVAQACLRGKMQGDVYNVGSGSTVSILEAAHLVREVCASAYGQDVTVRLPGDVSTSPPMPAASYFCVVGDKCRAQLGMSNSIGLREGIRATLEFYQGRENR